MWAGSEGQKARLLIYGIRRYGGSSARDYACAREISSMITGFVKADPTPDGYNMIPGFSSGPLNHMGMAVGATRNGRLAGAPIAMDVAIAGVQPGYGNTAPMPIEMDAGIVSEEEVSASFPASLLVTSPRATRRSP